MCEMKATPEKRAFLFGFAALFLCGIGDWLIGYDPPGGEPLIYGISNSAITAVPTWFYILSLFFGILSGFGCRAFAPVMLEVLDELGVPEGAKSARAFRFGLASAPMMFVSFHAACCIVLLLMQAALRAGLDVQAANSVFLLPVAASLLPFLLWCFLCDIPVTAGYVVLVLKDGGCIYIADLSRRCIHLVDAVLGWDHAEEALFSFEELEREANSRGFRTVKKAIDFGLEGYFCFRKE